MTEVKTPNLTTNVNPNKALWEKGDFTQLAETMRESGTALVEKLGIRPGMKVLDLGCGDGRFVITAVKRYKARGVCVDIDPERIRESRANASAKAGSSSVALAYISSALRSSQVHWGREA